MGHLWLRAESKHLEKRTLLIPEHAGALVRHGHTVTVEKSFQRIIDNQEYAMQGCTLVEADSWQNAPLDAYILGIKELPNETFPLINKHVYFAHVYKNQQGSRDILNRFKRGHGTLLDLEYVLDFRGKSLLTSAAGYWAGICGAAIAILIWCQKELKKGPPFNIPHFYDSDAQMIASINAMLKKTKQIKALVIGANGMAGSGAKTFLDKINVDYTPWTRLNTNTPGPLTDILSYDILLNCILASPNTSLFLNADTLNQNENLSVIGDISCDPTSPYNPLPLYNHVTTFENPTIQIPANKKTVDIIAIDHITTLLPRQASYTMAEQIFPYLCQLLMQDNNLQNSAWQFAIDEFNKHILEK